MNLEGNIVLVRRLIISKFYLNRDKQPGKTPIENELFS